MGNEGILAQLKRESNPEYDISSPEKNPVGLSDKGIGVFRLGDNAPQDTSPVPPMIQNIPGALPSYTGAQGIVDPTVGPRISNIPTPVVPVVPPVVTPGAPQTVGGISPREEQTNWERESESMDKHRGIRALDFANREIDALVDSLKNDPKNLQTQSMGKAGTITGGLKEHVANQIADLQKSKFVGAVEMAKAGVTGEYGLKGAKLRRGELDEIARGNLDAKIAHNKVMEQDFKLKMSQQKDIASQNQMNSLLNKHMVHETDQNDPEGKTKIPNWALTYASMMDSPTAPHPGFQPQIDEMRKRESAYVDEIRKATPVKDFNEKFAKAEFRKSLSMNYKPPVKKKSGWF
jgi:hypothetical protein